MKAIDLKKVLKSYKSGWVAFNIKNYRVVAHEKTFEKISDKVKNTGNVFLMPASEEYFGFVTFNAYIPLLHPS